MKVDLLRKAVERLPGATVIGATKQSLLYDIDGVLVTLIWTGGVALTAHVALMETKGWSLVGDDVPYLEVAAWISNAARVQKDLNNVLKSGR